MPAPSSSRPRTASGRLDAARHGRPRSPAPRVPGPGRRRTADAAPGRQPGPAPARTVASARGTRPLPVQLALHLCRAAHPCRTVHGRLHGQRRLHNAKPAAAVPGGLSRHNPLAYLQTTSCDGRKSRRVVALLKRSATSQTSVYSGSFQCTSFSIRTIMYSRAAGPFSSVRVAPSSAPNTRRACSSSLASQSTRISNPRALPQVPRRRMVSSQEQHMGMSVARLATDQREVWRCACG
jgi:hypothetical protein